MHTLWPKWQHFCSWVHPLCIVHPIVDDLTQKKCLFSSVETRPRQHLQMGWCMTMVLCVCVPRGFAKWSIYIIKKFLLKLTFLLEDDLLKFCLNGFDVSFILAEKKEIKPPTLDLFGTLMREDFGVRHGLFRTYWLITRKIDRKKRIDAAGLQSS